MKETDREEEEAGSRDSKEAQEIQLYDRKRGSDKKNSLKE